MGQSDECHAVVVGGLQTLKMLLSQLLDVLFAAVVGHLQREVGNAFGKREARFADVTLPTDGMTLLQ